MVTTAIEFDRDMSEADVKSIFEEYAITDLVEYSDPAEGMMTNVKETVVVSTKVLKVDS